MQAGCKEQIAFSGERLSLNFLGRRWLGGFFFFKSLNLPDEFCVLVMVVALQIMNKFSSTKEVI